MAAGRGSACAAVAGLSGALAACSAKVALGAADSLQAACWAALGAPSSPCAWLPTVLRVGCGCLVLACNAVMWTFFARALKHSSSSAIATVTSTASNFISSAVLGYLLFGETHALLWWIGISITLSGLLLLHVAPTPSEEQRHPKEKKM